MNAASQRNHQLWGVAAGHLERLLRRQQGLREQAAALRGEGAERAQALAAVEASDGPALSRAQHTLAEVEQRRRQQQRSLVALHVRHQARGGLFSIDHALGRLLITMLALVGGSSVDAREAERERLVMDVASAETQLARLVEDESRLQEEIAQLAARLEDHRYAADHLARAAALLELEASAAEAAIREELRRILLDTPGQLWQRRLDQAQANGLLDEAQRNRFRSGIDDLRQQRQHSSCRPAMASASTSSTAKSLATAVAAGFQAQRNTLHGTVSIRGNGHRHRYHRQHKRWQRRRIEFSDQVAVNSVVSSSLWQSQALVDALCAQAENAFRKGFSDYVAELDQHLAEGEQRAQELLDWYRSLLLQQGAAA